ncbi:MAG: aminodeoxychorismate synthase component I [Deltaproteobacteria bacterium]|nr:aminodeoxychorismate synthase component I [Deltaproteobacteria bacterium]
MPRPFIFAHGFDASARYSCVGADPFITIETGIDGTSLRRGGNICISSKDPFETILGLINELKNGFRESLLLNGLKNGFKMPFPFSGGMAGYFAYELKDMISGRMPKKDALDIPLCMAGLYDTVFIYDHHEKTGHLLRSGMDDNGAARFERIKDAIKGRKALPEISLAAAEGRSLSNVTKAQYIRMIKEAHEYIAAGDIYQINLSRRLQIRWKGEAFSLFRWLLKNRPAPFASFMELGGFQIISNSPERLLKVSSGVAETSPIKGTRPRGKTPEEDARMIEGLKGSVKENAEHVMIVDLERSDLGAVCEAASVVVPEFKKIETFPGLHHMTSVVRGRLRPGVSSLQCLKAIFPGGSVTGAPKIRAMEIIAELEKTPRGVYTGAIGWMDSSGGMDMAMPIRTAVYKNNRLHLSVGGGIVADSVPEDEYAETTLKADDFLKAVSG